MSNQPLLDVSVRTSGTKATIAVVGEPPNEAAHRLCGGLSFGDCGCSGRVRARGVHGLDAGGEVEGVVELAVTCPG
jgi:hypothetical protein